MANYTLKEAQAAVDWYKDETGYDMSKALSAFVVGEALDNFVDGIYCHAEAVEEAVCSSKGRKMTQEDWDEREEQDAVDRELYG